MWSMPSELPSYTPKTKLLHLILLTAVLSAFISASLGYNFLVTLILAAIGGSILVGVLFLAITYD